jgi:hypothetical protein
METINPKDVGKLDFDSISFITLKNGDMIMIDGSAPEKYKSEVPKYDNYSTKSKNNIQNLEVMKQLSFTYKGKNKYNNTIDKINNKIILKNDFNSISYPSKAMNLSFKGISNNKFALNNFQNLPIKQNIKKNSLFEISNINNNINLNNKRLSYNNPEINPNINTLKKATENNNNNSSETNSNNPPSSTRNNNINNLNIQTREMTEEEKLDQRIKRKSRNYLERLSLIFNEKNKPLVNAVISLKIPSDVNRQISETEKEFDMMVTQLKQKRSKYNFSRTGNNLYNKYYELYKDNNKEVKYLNLNRIKYYQEAENDNKENEPQMNNNETLNNNQRMVDNTFNINNTIYVNNKTNFGIGLTDTNLNNKVMNSFYGEKNRATRDNNNFSSRIRTNSSSSLVCPSNIIKNKLNSEF